MMIDRLGIKAFDFKENSFRYRDKEYAVNDLIELSKKYEVFDLQIKGIDLGVCPWDEITIKGFAYHMNRINKANLGYPIILSDEGFICDGWHRLVKAITEGKETIKAIRLEQMPEPLINK